MMQIPLWRQPLDSSLEKTKSQPESRYFQLATLSKEGYPQCRTVVFRRFSEQNHLQLVTDSRSEKWHELKNNPNVAICWYFAATREQYRIDGKALFDQATEQEVRQAWADLSSAGKKQFLWGEPKQQRSASYSLEVDNNSIPALPPIHFVVINIKVNGLDYLTLRGDPQTRVLYTQDGGDVWQLEPVIP